MFEILKMGEEADQMINGLIPNCLAFRGGRKIAGSDPYGTGEASHTGLLEAAPLKLPSELNRVLRQKLSERSGLVEVEEEHEAGHGIAHQLHIVE